MIDRRRHRRFALTQPLTADLRVVQDVVIESVDERFVTVITGAAGSRGESLSLSLGGHAGTLPVRTVASQPLTLEPGLRHRVLYEVAEPGADAPHGGVGLPRWADHRVSTSVLVRLSPARMLEVSARGALLQTSARFRVNDVAVLEIMTDALPRCLEVIRVCRVASRAGATPSVLAGVEFMPLYDVGRNSLRQHLARVELFPERPVVP